MTKYWTYFTVVFKDWFAYKADVFLGMIFNIIFFGVSFAIWTAVYREGGISQIGSFTLVNTITYYFITSIIFRFDASDQAFLGDLIWSGDLTNDLVRPYNARIISILDSLVGVLMNVLFFLPVAAIILLFAHSYIQLPTGANFIYFIIAICFGMLVNLSFFLIIHALTFHYGDQEASLDLLMYVVQFLAGATIPLAFFSGKFLAFLNLLPFKYIFYNPIAIYLGKMSVHDIVLSYLGALIWSGIFYAIFYLVFKSGLKKYTGIGR